MLPMLKEAMANLIKNGFPARQAETAGHATSMVLGMIKSPAAVKERQRHHLTSQVFLTSTNALAADGKVVNTDNSGNRVASMIFGPQQVIVIAGRQKIVRDADTARKRIKDIRTPLAARRLTG
jgi:hypothetical protein